MIKREITKALRAVEGKYPVLTLTGPRQSGKTTLIKALYGDWPYFSLENPDTRSLIEADPRSLFQRFGHRMVLDEVQHVPELLSYIQTIVDEDREAFFVLSGSQNLLMLDKVSQSLAGRAAIFYLLPLSFSEVAGQPLLPSDYEGLIYQGLYPRIYDRELDPQVFFANYLETYVQRDVRQIKNIGNLSLFTRFMSACASFIGQTLNKNALANLVGVDDKTVQSWLSILESSFIVYLLKPYYRNFNKRLIKSPRLYFHDTGLASRLLNFEHPTAVNNYFQRGALFENLILNEFVKHRYHQGLRPQFYYWRESSGPEIDLIIDKGDRLLPIEIKAARTMSTSFFKNMARFEKISALPVEPPVVIYGGEQSWDFERGRLLSWREPFWELT